MERIAHSTVSVLCANPPSIVQGFCIGNCIEYGMVYDMEPILITQIGKDEMIAELEHRVVVIRAEVGKRIAEARALGDLSENAEYHSARDEARKNEGRIEELQEILKRVKVIAHKNHDRAELSAKVTLLKNGDTELAYTLVSAQEADIRSGKLSIQSPIGMLLAGKEAGDEFVHTTPSGEVHYRIIAVE
jgi:transcription elongation factor GreA